MEGAVCREWNPDLQFVSLKRFKIPVFQWPEFLPRPFPALIIGQNDDQGSIPPLSVYPLNASKMHSTHHLKNYRLFMVHKMHPKMEPLAVFRFNLAR